MNFTNEASAYPNPLHIDDKPEHLYQFDLKHVVVNYSFRYPFMPTFQLFRSHIYVQASFCSLIGNHFSAVM